MSLPTETVGPFDVRTDDLMQVDPTQAVELFRQLLVIEAATIGLPTTGVDVPASINVADGGIDADVAGVAGKSLPAALIAEGKTCYQIKTGDFSASKRSEIRSLVIQPKFAAGTAVPSKDQLQPRVLSCFEKGGSFVVVLFGTDLVGKTDDHGEKQIRDLMASVDPAFAAAKVRIIRANQLCTAIKTLAPGIARRLNRVQGYDKSVFYDLTFMAEACELEIDSYQLTDDLKTFADEITQVANSLDGFKHIRILGDAGAGKTHLMYRALAASQLAGCVLYCPDPEQAMDSGPMEALRQMAPGTVIVLVADDCDLETSRELSAYFRKRATKMLLMTANNLAEAPSSHVDVQLIEMPSLLQPKLAEIFKAYGIVADEADWFAGLCEGSPRAAHRLGQYIRNNPKQHFAEHFAHLDDLWNGIVCSPHSIDSADGQDSTGCHPDDGAVPPDRMGDRGWCCSPTLPPECGEVARRQLLTAALSSHGRSASRTPRAAGPTDATDLSEAAPRCDVEELVRELLHRRGPAYAAREPWGAHAAALRCYVDVRQGVQGGDSLGR